MINVEVTSVTNPRVTRPVNARVFLLNQAGDVVAWNDDDLESPDPTVLDFVVPPGAQGDGGPQVYYVVVDGGPTPGRGLTAEGDYELMVSTFRSDESHGVDRRGGHARRRRRGGHPRRRVEQRPVRRDRRRRGRRYFEHHDRDRLRPRARRRLARDRPGQRRRQVELRQRPLEPNRPPGGQAERERPAVLLRPGCPAVLRRRPPRHRRHLHRRRRRRRSPQRARDLLDRAGPRVRLPGGRDDPPHHRRVRLGAGRPVRRPRRQLRRHRRRHGQQRPAVHSGRALERVARHTNRDPRRPPGLGAGGNFRQLSRASSATSAPAAGGATSISATTSARTSTSPPTPRSRSNTPTPRPATTPSPLTSSTAWAKEVTRRR